MKRAIFIAVAVLLAGVVSAQVDEKMLVSLQAELTQNRLKWKSFGVTTYTLKQRRSCFCLPESLGPFDVQVVNGAITKVTFSADSNLSGTPDASGLFTIETAFDRIQSILASAPGRDQPLARLTVDYDPTLGYITNFFVDFDARIADEELGFTFELLTPVGTPSPSPSPPVIVPVPLPQAPKVDPREIIKFRLNQAKWRAVGPKSYKYRLRRLCFCFGGFTGPFVITVEDGSIVDVVFEGQGPAPSDFSDLPTIDGLLDIVEESLKPGEVAKISVEYDKASGAPLTIAIDRILLAIDDEITYTAELLEGFVNLPIFPHPTLPSRPLSPPRKASIFSG